MSNKRRNKRGKNTIFDQLTTKNFLIIILVLFFMIAVFAGMIGYRSYQDRITLAKQKEELNQQIKDLFTETIQTIAQENENHKPDKVIRIAAVGDILCGDTMLEDAKKAEGYDFSPMFRNMSSLFKDSDIVIGTLETNLTTQKYSGYGLCNSPKEFLTAVKDSGINFVSLSHNHALDYGKDGLQDTIDQVKEIGLQYTGIKQGENDFTGNIQEYRGVKIAFLAYTYGLSKEDRFSQEELDLVNIFSEEKAQKDLEYAKQNSDYICVFMHWGDVNDNRVSSTQENWTNFLVENGADIILGSHPAVIEPMEVKQNSEGKNVFIAYSLGNYISSLPYDNSDVELILNIEIRKSGKDGKTYLSKVNYTPIYQMDYGKNVENRYELVDMKKLAQEYANGNTEVIDKKTYDILMRKLDWLEGIVRGK